jgi:hypothetical protein
MTAVAMPAVVMTRVDGHPPVNALIDCMRAGREHPVHELTGLAPVRVRRGALAVRAADVTAGTGGLGRGGAAGR